jgi:hypothetical protein
MTATSVDPVVRELSQALLARVDELGDRMAERIAAQAPAYAEEQVVSRAELVESCRDNLRFVLGNLAGQPELGIDTPQRTGMRRAESGVSESTVLQAFRIGARFIWEVLVENADDDTRDVLLRAAADIWTVSDDLSTAVTDAYRATAADRARHDRQVRAVLLNTLLDGTVDAATVRESAAMLGLTLHGTFTVVAAECPGPGEDALPHIEDRLRRNDITSVWRVGAERQEGVVVLRPRWGAERLAAEVQDIALGRVGLSAPFTELDEAPAAVREARLALAVATPRTRTVARYDDHPVAVLLASTPDLAEWVAQRVLGRVLELAELERTVLIDTVRVWLDEQGATSSAAKLLHVHRNTVRYRLRHLEELTGRSLTKPTDLADLYVALECARILGLG